MAVEFKASHRYARIASRKAQLVMDMIRGMPAGDALDTLRNDPHRAASLVYKVLASAVANAMQDPEVRPNRLMVSRAHADGGPLLFGRIRYRPSSMGRAMPFRRRTSHLHVFVSDPGLSAGREVESLHEASSAEAAGEEN